MLGPGAAAPSTEGFPGPVDSCSENGIERGNGPRRNVFKSLFFSKLQDISGQQHLSDHWDLDHPFERILVDTAVAPRSGVSDLDQLAGHVRRDASRADRHPRQDRRRLYARSGHRRVSLGTADVDARRSSAPSTAPQVTSSRTRRSSSAPKADGCPSERIDPGQRRIDGADTGRRLLHTRQPHQPPPRRDIYVIRTDDGLIVKRAGRDALWVYTLPWQMKQWSLPQAAFDTRRERRAKGRPARRRGSRKRWWRGSPCWRDRDVPRSATGSRAAVVDRPRRSHRRVARRPRWRAVARVWVGSLAPRDPSKDG